MTAYRFLPFVRQGLATSISRPDPLDGTLPPHVEIPVRVRVNAGSPVGVDVMLHGPGDVIGVDPRGIVRVDPAPNATGVEPNYLAAIEFDRPDFPWMFTPASPGASDRLRPWLVLVVVQRTDDTHIAHQRARPLPTITVDAAELPDLDDSWAWAHAQVITEVDSSAAIAETIRTRPDLTVGRVLCPRRLGPNTEYLACLVPAFAAGVLAGSGSPADVPALAPAWHADSGRIQLPVYHHWEFATGPGGDFESLARRLAPPDRPLELGTTTVFIGRADPGLPDLDDAAALVEAEGALVGPFHDVAGQPVTPSPEWSAALAAAVDAGSTLLGDGGADLPSVSPPLYGGWPAAVQTVPAGEPAWVREVNLDPRSRIAAGVGVGVVRVEQEELVHDAWLQVGDVLAANALLDRGRMSREVQAVLHRRLFGGTAGTARERAFRIATPALGRILLDGTTVATRLRSSAVPDAVASPAFRRMTSRRGTLLRRAARHADTTQRPALTSIVAKIDGGVLAAKPAEPVPDSLTGSQALTELDVTTGAGQVDLSPIGGKRTIDARILSSLRIKAGGLSRIPNPSKIVARPDLKTAGVVLSRSIFVDPGGVIVARQRTSIAGDEAAVAPTDPITPRRAAPRPPLPGGPGRIPPVRPPAERPVPRPPTKRPPGSGPPDPRPPTKRPPGSGPPDPRPPTKRPPGTGPPDPRPPRETTTQRLIRQRFESALAAHVATLVDAPDETPAPVLGLEQVNARLVSGTDPRSLVPARVASMVQVLDDTRPGPSARIAPTVVTSEPGLRGLRGAPRLDRPMYEAVAAHAPEWLLPGIGNIPTDTVALLTTNPRAVEAIMIGANSELLGELVWREYPTRRDGTPLRRFWDRTDGTADLPDLATVAPTRRLGRLGGGDGTGDVVMVVRGELLRRYPDAIVSLVRSTSAGTLSSEPADRREAILRGRIEPDVTFVGFDADVAEIVGDPGFFFVIQQQPTEPRFGFDVPAGEATTPATWRDATWAHVDVAPGGHLHTDPARVTVPSDAGGATWMTNSAHLATIAMQQPVRVAIHARELLKSQVP